MVNVGQRHRRLKSRGDGKVAIGVLLRGPTATPFDIIGLGT